MEDNKIEVQSTQFIVVNIGIEQYGIDIKYVDNIVRMQKITRVPKAQKFFNGVINLRGEIVPIMSIRRKFELDVCRIQCFHQNKFPRPHSPPNSCLHLFYKQARLICAILTQAFL